LRGAVRRATTAGVTTAPGAIAATDQGARAAADAWRAVRGAKDIQFAPVPPDPPVPPKVPAEPPAWLEWLGKLLDSVFGPIARFFGANWNGIEVLLLILAIAGAAWIAWAVLWPLWRDRKVRAEAAESEWLPDREAAVALLDDADRLAAEGRYGEAAHLLLQRSVHQIAAARPDWLSPSSTAREIGGNSALPARARGAFSVIAREVERSLFALRGLALEDWQRARAAYAEFALADLGAGS
jgi:hypothetical protein